MNSISKVSRRALVRDGALLCSVSCFFGTVHSAELITQASPLGAFEEILISTVGDLELVADSKFGYSITAEPHVVKAITFKISAKKLLIEAVANFDTKRPLKIIVRLPVLSKLEASGSVDIKSNVPTQREHLELVLNGSSGAKMSAIQSHVAVIRLAGSGALELSGTVDKVKLTLTGSAGADLKKLQCVDADVTISGSGEVNVAVSKILLATITGAGDIGYIGEPKVTTRISGAGDVQRIR